MKQILDLEETVPRYVTVKRKIGYTEYLMDRASMTTDASGKFSVDLYIKETKEYIGRYLLSEIIYNGDGVRFFSPKDELVFGRFVRVM